MNSSAPETDIQTACYRALVGERDADTCCKRICVMIQRILDQGEREPHESYLIVLANQLMSATRSFGIYILKMHEYLKVGNFEAALMVGRAMVQHETMLHEIAAGKPMQNGASIN